MIRNIKLDSDTIKRLGSQAGRIDGPLVAGQVSRRLLAIHGVLTEVEGRYPALFEAAGLAESRHVLAEAQRADRESATALLRVPAVGSWAMHCGHHLATARTPESLADDIGHFGAIAAVAALRTERPFEVTARVREDGILMFPTLGLARGWSSPGWVRIRSDDGSTLKLIQAGSSTRTVSPDDSQTDQWWPLRQLRSTVGGLTIALYLDDIDPYRGHHLPPVAERLTQDEVAHWARQLDEAWAVIAEQPDQARALSVGMVSVVPLKTDARTPSVSATARHAIGAAGITSPDGSDALAEALVHEHQHSLLWAVLDIASLVDDGADQRFYAPWRSDPRPARGLLHGAFAFLGLLRYWASRSAADQPAIRMSAAFELALWRVGVRTSIDQLAASGLLTTSGLILIEGMRSTLEDMSRRPVPEKLHEMAVGAVQDLQITWRLRNLRPDTGSVRSCCSAWRNGERRPTLGTSVINGEGPRFSGTPRLALLRRQIACPDKFETTAADARAAGGAAAADVYLAEGDCSTAADLYAAAAVTAVEQIEAWAGLILAWRDLGRPEAASLMAHPEYLHAVYACVAQCTGQRPDADEFAAWFAAGSQR